MNLLDFLLACAFFVSIMVVYVRLHAAYTLVGRTGWRFSCAHCRKRELHSIRTFEADLRGIRKLFCGECHRAWLAAHPISAGERRTELAWRWMGLLPLLIAGGVLALWFR
jgi:hypothetical protein